MTLREILNKKKHKHTIVANNFEKGFFYFFGLTQNPYEKAIKEIYLADVAGSLKKDWGAVSSDFNKFFTQESECIDVEK